MTQLSVADWCFLCVVFALLLAGPVIAWASYHDGRDAARREAVEREVDYKQDELERRLVRPRRVRNNGIDAFHASERFNSK